MCCKTNVRIDIASGLHLRPAAKIAEAAADFPGEIRMSYQGRIADAHSVVDILSLGVPEGGVVLIEADRLDAPYVLEQIRLVSSGLTTEPS